MEAAITVPSGHWTQTMRDNSSIPGAPFSWRGRGSTATGRAVTQIWPGRIDSCPPTNSWRPSAASVASPANAKSVVWSQPVIRGGSAAGLRQPLSARARITSVIEAQRLHRRILHPIGNDARAVTNTRYPAGDGEDHSVQLIDGQAVFSATDLVGYLACEHLTALERAALARSGQAADARRPRARRHPASAAFVTRRDTWRTWPHRVGASPRSIRNDEEDRGEQIRRQAAETLAAMASGADVIFQATFFDGRWLGYADFLERVESPERPSTWGPYHYEVADTKLAKHVKAGAVLQICSYVEQLTRLQGVEPEEMRVVLGGSAREVATLRVGDYMSYYRAAKRRFEEAVLGTEASPAAAPAYPPASSYPEPVDHCAVCRWAELCVKRRRDDDHLSLVAGISGRQRKSLLAREIDTVERLAAAPIPFDPPLDGAGAASMERVREQARIQVQGRGLPKPRYELFEPAPGEPIDAERGLATLPEPNEGDLFLDLEGDPYAFDDGIDYLFGVLDTAGDLHADLVVRSRRRRGDHACRREGGLREAHGPAHRASRRATRACTSTTTPRTSRRR